MQRPHRLTTCVGVALLVLVGMIPVGSLAQPAAALYVGHSARLTARIPSGWDVDPTRTFDYRGDDGFVASGPASGGTLDEACATLATSPSFDLPATVAGTAWSAQPACRVVGRVDGLEAVALVVPHPRPFTLFGAPFAFAAVVADPAHLDAIAATIDFSPDRVTPAIYVTSVLDIVEARAYWAGGVDWGLTRRSALASIGGLETVEEAQGALLGIVDALRSAGDNHSRVFLRGGDVLAASSGFGLMVGSRQVVVVYPDGPAARAGVHTGDVVEEVDGVPFTPTLQPVDPVYLWGSSVALTLRRPGVPDPVTVTVAAGPYDVYLPPTGRRLADDIGYVALPHFFSVGRESAYAATASEVVAAADEPPACAWVVDLRLDDGGIYFPMITGVGSILGDGTFFGRRSAGGRQSWVSYDHGRIVEDGKVIADYLGPDRYGELRRVDPPVAVLVGPQTGSSGEVAAMAFVGRPGARLFGESTGGFTTANDGYNLFDGAYLLLAGSAMTDRTGATHLDGIEPDEPVATDWSTFGTDHDPVIVAATAWLSEQPACEPPTDD